RRAGQAGPEAVARHLRRGAQRRRGAGGQQGRQAQGEARLRPEELDVLKGCPGERRLNRQRHVSLAASLLRPAMSSSSTVLQMHQREEFERNVMRGLAAGAGAGLLAFVTQTVGARLGIGGVPLAFLAIAGTALASVRGDRMDKLMLGALALVLPAAPWLFG